MTDIAIVSPSIWIADADPQWGAASLLRRALAFSGIQESREIDANILESIDLDRNRPSPLMVSLSFIGEQSNQNYLIEGWCERKSLPWVRIAIDSSMTYADAGPVFLSGHTPCYGCFAKSYLDESNNTAGPAPLLSTTAFWCNMLAPYLASIHARAKHLDIPDGFKRYNLVTLDSKYLRRSFSPHCRCRKFKTNADSRPSKISDLSGVSHTALIYEDCTAKEHPIQELQSKSSPNFVSRSLILTSFPNSTDCAPAQIPSLAKIGIQKLLEAKVVLRSNSLALDDLTAILFFSAGLRAVDSSRSHASRWAANAGNLGSPELFVFANRISGLTCGLYRYRAIAHDLVNLKFQMPAFPHALPTALSEGEAFVCFVGSYYRLQQKYGAFAYRLVHLDAGVAFSQASLVAASLGARLTPVQEVDEDEATRWLNLSRLREYTTAFAYLSVKEPTRKWKIESGNRKNPNSTSSGCSLGMLSKLWPDRLTEQLYRESVTFASYSTEHTAGVAHEVNPEPIKRSGTPTSEGAGDSPLMEVLMKRVSVRRFAQEVPSKSELVGMLRATYNADAMEWPQEHSQGRPLRFFLLQNDKDGYKALYEYRHSHVALNPVKSWSPSGFRPPIYVDTCFEHAPAAIWIVGNLAEAIAAHASYGHRQLLFRSGAAANRLWLTAIGCGMAGTISAGILPRTARQILGFDGWTSLVLCAFIVGFTNDVTQS